MSNLKDFELYKNPDDNWKEENINGRILKFPKDLKLTEISKIGKLLVGNNAPQKIEDFKNGNISFFRVSDYQNKEGRYLIDSRDKINIKCAENLKLIKKGSLLMTKSGMSSLNNQRALLKYDSYVVNHYAILDINNNYNKDYIYYKSLKIDFNMFAIGTSLPAINNKEINSIKIITHSLEEQEKIASVLATQEELISSKKELLSKNKKQRKYFQQELLSGRIRIRLNQSSLNDAISLGLIDNNEIQEDKKEEFEEWLNNDFESKIELYKNSDWKEEKINGRNINIPNDWGINKLENVAKFQNGFSFNKTNYIKENNGFEIIEVGSIAMNGGYNKKVKNIKYVNPKYIESLKKYRLNLNDILIPMSDMSYEKKHVGTPFIVDKEDLYLNQRVGRIFDININIKYLYFNILKFQNYFGLNAQGQGPYNLGVKPILNYNILLTSSLLEQTIIATQLTKIDNLIDSLEEEIKLEDKKFTYLKQELLSGRIRVR